MRSHSLSHAPPLPLSLFINPSIQPAETKRNASAIAAPETEELKGKKQRQEEAHGSDGKEAAPARSPALLAELAAAAKDAAAPLRASLFGAEAEQRAAESFKSARPFPHIVIRDLIVDSVSSPSAAAGAAAGAAASDEEKSSPAAPPLSSSLLLRAVRDEILEHVTATYKETDLFRVFQTGDLANIDGLPREERETKLPALCALRAALSSEKFVSLVERVTGCGALAPGRVDLSCNVYAPRGHLLAHDDVIGSRRVSFIVYLTDPDEPWDAAADGGALELYPLVSSSSSSSPSESNLGDTAALPPPSVAPSALLPPFWNSMAMFVVTPGVSYHSVQEVTAKEGKARMSISGWYHAPQAPEGAESAASLAQLRLGKGQDAVQDHAPFVDVVGESEEEEEKEKEKEKKEEGESAEARALRLASLAPTERDLAHLARFVSRAYLRPQAWAAVRRKFEEDGSVQLHGFLRPELARALAVATKRADNKDGLGRRSGEEEQDGGKAPRPPPSDYFVGARGGWTAVGPPHKQRYLRFEGAAASEEELEGVAASASASKEESPSDPGPLLSALRRDLFSSLPFFRLLKQLTTVAQLGAAGEVRRFRPGLDYSVAHYGVLTSDPRLDAVLCFVDDGSLKEEEKVKKTGHVNDDDDSEWAAGEVGGFEAYVLGDDDDEEAGAVEAGEGGVGGSRKKSSDAAVYKKADDDGDSGVLNVPAAANCLSLLLRDEGLMRFVKYVSAAAPGSRWDLAMEYKPQDDDDDEEDEEGGK